MSIKKIILSALAALIIILPLTGCADYKNIEDLNIVAGVAIDKKDGRYILCSEIVKPAGDGNGGEVEPLVVKAVGVTLSDAVDRTMEQLGGQAYFEQCKILIIGEKTAKEGELKTLVDWITGSKEFHISGTVLICKNAPASEIFGQKPLRDPLVSIEIDRVLENQKNLTCRAPDVTIADINNAMDDRYGAVMLPAISVMEEDGKKQNRVDGAALFDGQRLVGFLDGDETGYLLFAADKTRGGVLIKRGETGVRTYSGARVLSNKTVLTPEITGGNIGITVRTQTKISLTEPVRGEDFAQNPEDISDIEREFAWQLSENIESVIEKVQNQYGCDVLGFRHTLIEKYPGQADELNRNWPEKLKEIEVGADSEVSVIQ